MTDDTDTTDDGSDASPADAWTDDDGPTDAATGGDAGPTDAVTGADGGHGVEAEPSSDEGVGVAAGRDVREYLLKGALVMLVVLGVVATLQFYVHAQTAIGRLVATDYRPLFLAGFNLAVLLAVGISIAQVVRRLG